MKAIRLLLLLMLLGWASLAAPAAAEPPPYPAPATSHHRILLDGRTLAYRATAGAMTQIVPGQISIAGLTGAPLRLTWMAKVLVPVNAGIFKLPITAATGYCGRSTSAAGVCINPPPPTIDTKTVTFGTGRPAASVTLTRT